ncbi:hypothetical protein [Brucella intermedia]|uniref:hypothetical protein n=1 Tax=Brucella intermedia TaxID=94625 RepID=UPI00224A9CAD|nr:hypothetical protein [Brucella intermedia]
MDDELIEICIGGHCRVLMTRQVLKQFKKTDARERARITKWMGFYAKEGHDLLDNEKLKHEGKFSSGMQNGTLVSIWAFKAWQIRLYGGHAPSGDFVITEFDIKKQDHADQEKLKQAAKKLANYL